MELKEAIKLVNKQISQLEATTHMFEYIVKPRYEQDKKILDDLREQVLKMSAIEDKIKRGEEVTVDEIHTAIPPTFR